MALDIETRRQDGATAPNESSKELISVVIPLYNEQESLEPLHGELTEVLNQLGNPYELIFVNDGSNDGSSAVLERICESDSHVSVLHFRRNFGKSAALAAGFEESRGAIIFTLDADLQDDPHEIPKFLAKLREGYDLVSGWKYHRHDPVGKTLPSKLFNKTVSATTGLKLHDFNCGFKAYRREVLKHVKLYGELHRFIPALAHGNGFKVAEIVVNHRPRKFGKSKYGIARFTRGMLDLLTVLFITRYTKKPLHLFGAIGLMLLLGGTAVNAYLAVIWLMGHPIGHRPLLSLGVLLMILGFQFIATGLLGEMITHNQRTEESPVARRVRHSA